MVVKIRLQRFGRKHLPFYRIVCANSKAPRDGKFHEMLGTYNPIATKDQVKEITANADRIRYWLTCGAQPTDRVAWLLGKIGIIPPPVQFPALKTTLPKAIRKIEEAKAKDAKAKAK